MSFIGTRDLGKNQEGDPEPEELKMGRGIEKPRRDGRGLECKTVCAAQKKYTNYPSVTLKKENAGLESSREDLNMYSSVSHNLRGPTKRVGSAIPSNHTIPTVKTDHCVHTVIGLTHSEGTTTTQQVYLKD